jgi:hypothetical protein
LWPDNVHETGVSPGGVTGSPIVAGEGAGRANSKKFLVTGPIRGFCAPQAALAIALLGVVALWPKGTRTPHSLEPNVRLVVFTTGDNKITARITDPLAAASQLSAVFHQHTD